MSLIELLTRHESHYAPASPTEIKEIQEDFAQLYFPNIFTERALNGALAARGEWSIGDASSPTSRTTIREWADQLEAPEVSRDFKGCLAHISSSPRGPSHRKALEPFLLARFCEFRVALAAQKLPAVQLVSLSQPNSDLDASKADLLISIRGKEGYIPLQVKAVDGRKNDSAHVPTIKLVWRRNLDSMLEDLAKTIDTALALPETLRNERIGPKLNIALSY
jgi:hypothetical protein